MHASKIVADAQSLDETFAGAAEYGCDIKLVAVERIWPGLHHPDKILNRGL